MHPASPISLASLQEMRGQKRLDFLLRQAEVFQHFAPTSAGTAAERKKKRGRHATGYTEEMEDEGKQSVCVCVCGGGWLGTRRVGGRGR